MVVAYITSDKERVLSGSAIALRAENEEQKKEMAMDIAKATKADVVQLKSGDYLILRQ